MGRAAAGQGLSRRGGAVRAAEVGSVVRAVARHPSLWWTAVVQAWRLAPRGWWGRPPFLPVPSPAYLRFRTTTQYGQSEHPIEPGDVVNYLHWCRAWAAVER